MGASGAKKVEETKKNFVYELRCNSCEKIVRLTCDYEVTEAQLAELQKRLLCHPCLKLKLNEKK